MPRVLVFFLALFAGMVTTGANSEDEQHYAELTVSGTSFNVMFDADILWQRRQIILPWITQSAETVTTYFGKFPVKTLDIALISVGGSEVKNGLVLGGEVPIINISIGELVSKSELNTDWIMVHEMAHLAFPGVKQRWIEEGMATYVESIARANVGDLSPQYVWREMINRMPQGQPEAADKGLDNTPTWGRIYWGGAIFCLVADVEIRRRTDNKLGLQDAFRGILAAGYSLNNTAELTEVFLAADKATGVPVLTELYNQHKDSSVPFDLDKLWRELGISLNGDTIKYDHAAPLAAVRKSIIPDS